MNLILLCILGAIWGTSFLFIKIIVTEIPPLTLVAGRTGFAALILWGFILLRKIRHPRLVNVWRTFAIVGLFLGTIILDEIIIPIIIFSLICILVGVLLVRVKEQVQVTHGPNAMPTNTI